MSVPQTHLPDTMDFASKDPGRVSGAVVFKGTRVPVEQIVNHLKGNYTIDGTLRQFPSVDREQVEAFLDWALQTLEAEMEGPEVTDADPA